jgi:hypothetical protein
MNRLHAVLAAAAIALPYAAVAGPESPRVYSDAGNIFLDRDGAKTQLTKSEQDVDPVLSPDSAFVVFTRQGRARTGNDDDDDQMCDAAPKPDELRQINVDGTAEKLLLRGRKGKPEEQVCRFTAKQFSSDGRRLYFLSPGWTTSGALHVFDMRKQDERFVMPANDVLVLSFCRNEYKDDLVVASHRYFVFGGSYDWYWLYDASGQKEIGPLGEFENPDNVVKRAREEWCSS